MEKLPVGKAITMTVKQKAKDGYLLKKDGEQAVLPLDHTDKQWEVEDQVKVFLYQVHKGELLATTFIPSIQIDQFGWAKVVEVLPIGAFIDIGIPKDVLLPADYLPTYTDAWPKAGNKLFVQLDTDKQGRLLAILAKEDDFFFELEYATDDMHNKTVEGTIYLTRREGAACITKEGYRGFIHHTERKEEPRLGDKVTARVIHVKEDGSLNLSLLPYKKESMQLDAEMILRHLEEHDGMIPFSDKSDPEDIRATFQISKAAFKRALGRLMKEGKIEQRDGNTYLK